MKKVGIIGSGAVAKALGNGFLKYGYAVKAGSRDQAKLQDWKTKGGENASIGSFEETANFGDLLVLAVKGHAAVTVLKSLSPESIKGKTIIDTCNPIAAAPPVNGVLQFTTSPNASLMEELQEIAPDAHFVKAFNSIGSAHMVNPDFGTTVKPAMFICGNNDAAKAEVKAVLDQFGFDTQDMGKAEAARAIEPLCMLWCIPGFLQNQWSHAFALLKK